MENIFKVLEKLQNKTYVKIKDDKLYNMNGDEVVDENIYDRWKERHTNGYYVLSPYTCGDENDCSIGSPAQRCVDRKMVIPSCAKYDVSMITDNFSIADILTIVNELNKQQFIEAADIIAEINKENK